MKRMTIFLMAALLLTSCTEHMKLETVNTTDVTSADQSELVEETAITDEVPEMSFDQEMHFLLPEISWATQNVFAEEATGDRLNDARYEMKTTMEERFNTTITETITDKSWDTTFIGQMVAAGDDTYDICFVFDLFVKDYATNGMIYKLGDISYIDLEKPYWDQSLNECLTICGETYFGFGAFDLSYYDMTYCMIFNKDMINDYGLENPYELVNSGKWTYSKFYEMAKAAVRDVNGDSIMDDRDSYGYDGMHKEVLPCFWVAADTLCIDKDENDIPYLNISGNERFLNAFEEIFEMMWDGGIWFFNDEGSNSVDNEKRMEMFSSDRIMFSSHSFSSLGELRSMDKDFGIIPHPKYDETQDQYYSRIEGGCKIAIIPVTNKNPEFAGALLESMAAFGYNNIVPEYYEVSLKTKNSRDSESAEMLDLIFNNRRYDLADAWWCNDIRDGVFKPMFIENDRNLMSIIAKKEVKWIDSINEFVKALIE